MLSSLVPSPSSTLPHRRTPASRSTSTPTPTLSTRARTTLALEYASLRHAGHCPLGMYIAPARGAPDAWDGVLFVHQGYYSDAVLRFRVSFPASYPQTPPTVRFATEVFHPLVDPSDGGLLLSARFSPWNPEEHTALDVLHFIKSAFKKHALDDVRPAACAHREALRLYHDATAAFAALAAQSAALSRSAGALFDAPRGGVVPEMRFAELGQKRLGELRRELGIEEWREEGEE